MTTLKDQLTARIFEARAQLANLDVQQAAQETSLATARQQLTSHIADMEKLVAQADQVAPAVPPGQP